MQHGLVRSDAPSPRARAPWLAALGPHADRVRVLAAPADAARAFTLDAWATPAAARAAVDAFARAHDVADARVAASQWSKYYLACVVPAPLAAFTLADADVTTLLPRARLVADGVVPARFALPDEAPAAPAERAVARRALHAAVFRDAVAPTLAALTDATRVNPRVLWGNAGNLVAWLFDALAEHADAVTTARVTEDRDALLAAPADVLGVDARALRDAVRYEAGGERVRATCCLKDRMPGGTACYSCPALSVAERARSRAKWAGAR